MLLTCPKPLVAAVNGPAVGFGLSLIALCDFVFAADQACLYLASFLSCFIFEVLGLKKIKGLINHHECFG